MSRLMVGLLKLNGIFDGARSCTHRARMALTELGIVPTERNFSHGTWLIDYLESVESEPRIAPVSTALGVSLRLSRCDIRMRGPLLFG